jgi:hypothetical protein
MSGAAQDNIGLACLHAGIEYLLFDIVDEHKAITMISEKQEEEVSNG